MEEEAEACTPWGRSREISCFLKMKTQKGPGRLKGRHQVEEREGHRRPLPPMAASDLLSPVAGRRPELFVSGTPRGQVTNQVEIQHLWNVYNCRFRTDAFP